MYIYIYIYILTLILIIWSCVCQDHGRTSEMISLLSWPATTTTTTIITIIREGIPQNENVCGKVVLNPSFLLSFALLWGGFRHIDSGTIDK